MHDMFVLVLDLLDALVPFILSDPLQLRLGGLEGSMAGHLGLRVGYFVDMKLILSELLVVIE